MAATISPVVDHDAAEDAVLLPTGGNSRPDAVVGIVLGSVALLLLTGSAVVVTLFGTG